MIVWIPKEVEIRAIPKAVVGVEPRTHQSWYEDMITFNWNKVKRTTESLVAQDIALTKWADSFYETLLQANANANWVGRDLVAKGTTKFGVNDMLKARGFADVDAEYLSGFIDDILAGRYTTEDGLLNERQILARQRLYFGKVRGVAGQASVDALEKETLIYWRLGGVEKHCTDCPRLASISPFFKDDLFATPGSCDTECLGNCLCHLEFKINDKMVESIRPVKLN